MTALVCVVPKDKLTVDGPLKKYKGTADSGNAVYRWFCSECGSPIAHEPSAAPEIIALKGGSLDMEIKKGLKPVCRSSLLLLSPAFLLFCEIQGMGKMRLTVGWLGTAGYRDLDCQQAAVLPGEAGQAV
jgi:hypothetical protein